MAILGTASAAFVCVGIQTARAARGSMKPYLYLFYILLKEYSMNSIIYWIGAAVVIVAVLSFFGLR